MNQTPDELLFLQEVVEVIIFNYLQNVLFFACVFLLLLFHIYDSFVNLFDQCVCVTFLLFNSLTLLHLVNFSSYTSPSSLKYAFFLLL